ncbi:MAG: 3-deoxy-7-phosphoheptulonate synthase [Gemmatimonadota bacterium]|nr:3-deoxy-7-phosphoheptulonate synthase [Gemmatimonadota bacterium]
MIIVARKDITADQIDYIRERVEGAGLRTHISIGESRTIIGCIGDEARLANLPLLSIPGVQSVHPVMRPYKLAARGFSADPTTTVRVGDHSFGGPRCLVAAGPCSVEGSPMMFETGRAVAESGASLLRGGAFKPRTSPYSFDGLKEEGLRILSSVRSETGLPVVTEVLDPRDAELVASYADMLQIGARNMQNFSLLREVGQLQRPVLLKRGMSATLKDLLLAAEYVMSRGNMQVVLCERGIRTFGAETRNTFDLAAIPWLKMETHLPVIADPSHAGGRRDLVAPLSYAALAAGADGLIVEVHPDPETAMSDGDQSLTFAEFADLMDSLTVFAEAAGRSM